MQKIVTFAFICMVFNTVQSMDSSSTHEHQTQAHPQVIPHNECQKKEAKALPIDEINKKRMAGCLLCCCDQQHY